MQLNRLASKALMLATVIGAAAVLGCIDHSVTGPNSQSNAGLAVRLLLQDGNGQSGPVAAALPTPIAVKVVDANGIGVAGTTVTFRVRTGNGSLGSPTALSNASGVATTTWTMGTTLGASSIVAILSTALVSDSVVATATAVAGSAASAAISAGDQQGGAVGQQLVTSVTAKTFDAYGNVSPGQPVAWSVVSGGGSVTVVNATSDANGLSSARWTLGTISGTQVLRASVGTAVTADFRANATAAGAASFVQEAGNGQSGTVATALPAALSVRVLDSYGNGVPNATVSWAATDGSFNAASVTTDSLGRAQTRWTLGSRVGSQNATASLGSLPTVAFVATAQAGAASSVSIETGNNQSQTVGGMLPLPLVLLVRDQLGNGVSGVPVAWTVALGGGSLPVAPITTDVTGRARALWIMGSVSGPQLVTASISGQPLQVFSATATAGSSDTLVIMSGNNQSARTGAALPSPLIVRAADSHGNPVVNATVDFAITSGGGALSSALMKTDSAGRAQTNWTLGALVGAQTATASIGTRSVTFNATGTSSSGGVSTPSQLLVVSGNGQTGNVGQPMPAPVVVKVTDASGNPVSGVSVSWTLAAGNGGGSALPATSSTGADGTASTQWVLGSQVGLQQITATVAGLPALQLLGTAQLTASGAILINAGENQSRPTGTALPTSLQVLVVDQNGTAVQGARVNWAVATGGGSLSKAYGVTPASGLDAAVWTLGSIVGAQTVTASVTGVGSVTFHANATGVSGGTPSTLTIVSGSGQVGRSATALTSPLVVQVRDGSGNPVSGVQVQFDEAATNTDGFVSPSPTYTDSTGKVSVTWTLGKNVGNTKLTNTVWAKLPAFAAIDSIKFTADARPAYRVRLDSTNFGGYKYSSTTQSDTTGATLQDTLVVQVFDPSDSSGVQGVQVTWATEGGSCFDGDPVNAVVTTDNRGFAKNRWVLRTTPLSCSNAPSSGAILPSNVAKRMLATVSGIGQVEYQAIVSPGRLNAFTVTTPATKDTVSKANVITIKVTDANGYGIVGATAAAAVSAGSVTPASQLTTPYPNPGFATVTWTFGGAAGSQTLTFTVTTSATGPYVENVSKTFFIPYAVNP